MKKTQRSDSRAAGFPPWRGAPVALLWDQSMVWGLICVETLNRLGVSHHVLGASDVAAGALGGYHTLLVPGGWASHKVKSLEGAGKERIGEFIAAGGSYLGFCGGAGLALSSPPALGLVPIGRMPVSERLPSASGGVWIRSETAHPAWKDLPQTIPVSIWWPSQFQWQATAESMCLASYWKAGNDFCVADLTVTDMENEAVSWPRWERSYGINLDPGRLLGHPAIVEVRRGRGRLVLSYPHLETPGDFWGNRLFHNLLVFLDLEASRDSGLKSPPEAPAARFSAPPGREALRLLQRARESAEALIEFGERHLFWRWRTDWLLNWRRGIRGLEYGSMAVALRSLFAEASRCPGIPDDPDPWEEPAGRLESQVRSFCTLARRLLLEEKRAAQNCVLTKLGSIDKTVDELRGRLFGRRMDHGGVCRDLFDGVDDLLLQALRLNGQPG